MLDCLIVGDSIAVGTHHFKQECVAYAKSGINSWQWNKTYGGRDYGAEVVVISLGTNDHKGIKTSQELEKMRSRIKADRVYWIMPPCNDGFCKPEVNEAVKHIANMHGDLIIGTAKVQKDNVHPSWNGYKELAKEVE